MPRASMVHRVNACQGRCAANLQHLDFAPVASAGDDAVQRQDDVADGLLMVAITIRCVAFDENNERGSQQRKRRAKRIQ